jgi:uncharacterized protein (DUF1697 family)
MPRFVALLRAFNVAGHARASTSELSAVFAAAGCRGIRSYGHAGNLIFDLPARALPATLRRAGAGCAAAFGEAPTILVRPAEHVRALAAEPPFAAADRAASRMLKLYVAFLAAEPTAGSALPIVDEKERLEAIAVRGTEAFIVSRPKPSGFFGMPNDFIERALGVTATCRNWSTVRKLAAMLAADGRG